MKTFWQLLCCAGWVALAGCSTEPRLEIVPPEARQHSKTPVLVDHGKQPATSGEYQALLKDNTSELETRTMLDQLLKVTQAISGSRLIAGNDARLLIDGPRTFNAMFEDIDKAQHHIHLETFILEDDRIGQALTERLIASRQRGVEIRLQFDAYGSLNLSEAFIARLEDEGIELHKFHPIDPTEDLRVWRINERNHRKLLVIDGQIAYTGGINFHSAYSKGSSSIPREAREAEDGWRDTHVRIVGPAVRQFQQQFLQIWNKDLPEQEHIGGAIYFPSLLEKGDMIVGVITSDGDEENHIYSVLAAAIEHAQKRVWITQAYFAPNDAFIEIIKTAARRGVDVRLLLPGVSDASLVILASRSSYQELLEAGVSIYERTASTLHAKTLVIDGVWSSIGSANFDYRSLVYNHELNAVIVDNDLGLAVEKLFQKDLQQAKHVTLHEWRRRPLIQRLKETFGRLLRRWL